MTTELEPLVITLHELKKYIEDEADYNLSWADGRRGNANPGAEYIARRMAVVAEREKWAAAIGKAIELAAL